MEHLTPYILFTLGLLSAVLGFVIQDHFKVRERVARIETAITIYFDQKGKGAAMILDSPNPTPEPIRKLLRKHVNGTLSSDEREFLVGYLKRLVSDPGTPRAEFSPANDLLAAMVAKQKLKPDNEHH